MGPRWPDQRARHSVCAVLVAEEDNPYDANAVAVWVQGLKVGHLSRANARRYRPGLLSLQRRYEQAGRAQRCHRRWRDPRRRPGTARRISPSRPDGLRPVSIRRYGPNYPDGAMFVISILATAAS